MVFYSITLRYISRAMKQLNHQKNKTSKEKIAEPFHPYNCLVKEVMQNISSMFLFIYIQVLKLQHEQYVNTVDCAKYIYIYLNAF